MFDDLRAASLQAAAVAAAIVAIGAAHYLTPLAYQHWHELFQHLYFFPLVYAALRFGWRGGAAAALLVTLVHLPHVVDTWIRLHYYAIGQLFELPLFWAAGVFTGVFVERDRRHREQLARTTQQLSEVYEQLQRNFDAMKRAERLFAVGQLAAGLAHEIRNPLASIAGASGILQRNAKLGETHLKVLHVIDKECQRLARLLGSFLDFARPRLPKHQEVDLDLVFQSVIELARHASGSKTIELRRNTPAAMPPLMCDAEMIKQLLLNLVLNGIQASGEEGSVTISAQPVGDKMKICVADEGCGIDEENRDKIFDPFFTTKENGTGLGLSVAHQIVQQHGGVLTAEANEPRGTVFCAILPMRNGGFA